MLSELKAVKASLHELKEIKAKILKKYNLRYSDIIGLALGGIVLLTLIFVWMMAAQVLLGGDTGKKTIMQLLTGSITPLVAVAKSFGQGQESKDKAAKINDEMKFLNVGLKLGNTGVSASAGGVASGSNFISKADHALGGGGSVATVKPSKPTSPSTRKGSKKSIPMVTRPAQPVDMAGAPATIRMPIQRRAPQTGSPNGNNVHVL